MAIDRDTVHHTAELARLDLSLLDDAEVAALQGHLDQILAYVADLDGVDTSGVEPTTHAVPLRMPMRDDEPEPGPGREAILANAPETRDGCFAVPRVIAGDS